jgi:hypothetical protein
MSKAAFVIVSLFLLASTASAQLVDFHTSSSYSGFINTLINNKIWEASMSRYTRSGNQGQRSRSRPPASRRTQPEVVPAYRQYPAVRFKSSGTRLLLAQYLDLVGGTTQEKDEMRKLVLDILNRYESEAAAKGYPNDVALAFVSFAGLNSHVYNGRTEKLLLPFEQNIGLRDVVAEQATDTGYFNNLTDRKKQEMYEFLVMFGGLTFHLYEKALRENNVSELKNARLAAEQNLKLLGIMR